MPPYQKKIKINSLEIILGKKIIGSKGGGLIHQRITKIFKIILKKLPKYNDFITKE